MVIWEYREMCWLILTEKMKKRINNSDLFESVKSQHFGFCLRVLWAKKKNKNHKTAPWLLRMCENTKIGCKTMCYMNRNLILTMTTTGRQNKKLKKTANVSALAGNWVSNELSWDEIFKSQLHSSHIDRQRQTLQLNKNKTHIQRNLIEFLQGG